MQITKWGDITLVDAGRRLLANALLDHGNERFALLSDTSIPVYDLPTVHAYITSSNTSFVDSFANHDSEVRYNPFFAQRSNITLAQWRKGVDWFEMDRALAVSVVSDEAYLPAFREYCGRRRFCLMDEHYLPTLLTVVGWSHNANRTLTYEDWRRRLTPADARQEGRDGEADQRDSARNGKQVRLQRQARRDMAGVLPLRPQVRTRRARPAARVGSQAYGLWLRVYIHYTTYLFC